MIGRAKIIVSPHAAPLNLKKIVKTFICKIGLPNDSADVGHVHCKQYTHYYDACIENKNMPQPLKIVHVRLSEEILTIPGHTFLKIGYRTDTLRRYIMSGKTVIIWKKRNILAATVRISVL